MDNRNSDFLEVEKFLIFYLDTYFSERNIDKILSLLTDNMVGFGTGLDEIAQTKKDIIQLYTRDIEQVPNKIDYDIHNLFITRIAQNVYSANATLSIKTIIHEQEFAFNHLRLSLILVEKDHNYSISLMHISLPTVEHEDDEPYPIKELEGRNSVLQKLVDKQTAELKEALYEINILASTDKLTGLYNRHILDEKLIDEIARSSRYGNHLSLILIDVDHFKVINDKYGHLAGDKTLKALAQILQKNTRNTDLIGRWGGDEFLIICSETDSDQAYSVAEKIRTDVNKHHFSTQDTHTVSIGISTYQAQDSYDTLFQRADKAIYESKANGRNQVTN